MRWSGAVAALCVSVVALSFAGCARSPQIADAGAAGPSGLQTTASRTFTPWESSFGISTPDLPTIDPAEPPPVVILDDTTPIVDPDSCGGTPGTPMTRLDPSTVATVVTVCSNSSGYLVGSGFWWTVETRVVPAAETSRFVEALSTELPPFPEGASCAGVGWLFPTIIVTAADGSAVSADVPSDGCSPSKAAVQILDEIALGVTPAIARTSLRASENDVISGCLGAKAIYPDSPQAGESATLPDLTGTALSVCGYTTDSAENTTLQRSGIVDDGALRAVTSGLLREPPEGCTLPDGNTEIGSFVALVPRADPASPWTAPDRQTVLNVSADACHLVLDGSWDVLGWIDDSTYQLLVGPAG